MKAMVRFVSRQRGIIDDLPDTEGAIPAIGDVYVTPGREDFVDAKGKIPVACYQVVERAFAGSHSGAVIRVIALVEEIEEPDWLGTV